MDNEKKAGIIGGVTLGLYVIAALGFIALIGVVGYFFLTLRACTETQPNTGKAPYTREYVADYLSACYGGSFDFKDEQVIESNDATVYTFTDQNGVEATVVQDYEHGIFFNGHYEVSDNYAAARLFADEKTIEMLDSSGFEYFFHNGTNRIEGVFQCSMYAPTYEDIPAVAEALYGVAESCFLEDNDKASDFGVGNDVFRHRCPCLVICDSDGNSLALLNIPFTKFDRMPLKSLPEYISEAESSYTYMVRNDDLSDELPEEAYEQYPSNSIDYVTCNGERVDISFIYDAADETYVAMQLDCFSFIHGYTFCPMMEALGKIAGMGYAEIDDDDLGFFRVGDDEEHPFIRLYRYNYSLKLEQGGEPYTFSPGGCTISDDVIQLSTDDIYRLFGITVEINNVDSSAELIPPENN